MLLDGRRVLDLSLSVSAGWCGRLLSEAGADVVMIEPREGHPLRTKLPPGPGGVGVTASEVLAGKRAVALNLAERRGQRFAIDLARSSNVVLASHTREELAGIGVSVEAAARGNDGLVFVSVLPSERAAEQSDRGQQSLLSDLYVGTVAFTVVLGALLDVAMHEPREIWISSDDVVAAASGVGSPLSAGVSSPPVASVDAPLPRPGQHTFDVLRRVLNVTDDHLLYFFENGLIGPAD